MIVNTLVTADKHVTAKIHYNLRVVENRVGARLLARHLKLSPPSGDSGWDFGKVLHAQSEKTESEAERKDRSPKKQAERLEKMAKVAEDALGGEDGMTWHEVLKELEMDEKTFDDEVKGGYEVEAPDGKLKLLKRARHVVSSSPAILLSAVLTTSAPSVFRSPPSLPHAPPARIASFPFLPSGRGHGRADERLASELFQGLRLLVSRD